MSSNSNNNNTTKKKSKKTKWKSNKGSQNTKDTFKGDCEDLKGKTYFIGSSKQTDNYNTTTEAILDYFLREYTHGLDLVQSLKKKAKKDLDNEIPVMPEVADTATDAKKKTKRNGKGKGSNSMASPVEALFEPDHLM